MLLVAWIVDSTQLEVLNFAWYQAIKFILRDRSKHAHIAFNNNSVSCYNILLRIWKCTDDNSSDKDQSVTLQICGQTYNESGLLWLGFFIAIVSSELYHNFTRVTNVEFAAMFNQRLRWRDACYDVTNYLDFGQFWPLRCHSDAVQVPHLDDVRQN